MNAAHFHLMLVHIPVILVPVGLLLVVFARWRKNKVASSIGMSLFILSALVVIPAFLLGEGAEELVEDLAGISERLIEEHEESSVLALWLTVSLGLFSIASLVAESRAWRAASSLTLVTLVLSLCTSGTLAYAAQLGGMIRHPEAFPEQQKGMEIGMESRETGKAKIKHSSHRDDDD